MRSASAQLRSLGTLGLFLWSLCVLAIRPCHAESPPVRVRVEWTSPAPRSLAARLSVSDGSWDNPVSLSPEMQPAGSLKTGGRDLRVAHRQPAIYDGFDVDLRADAPAMLRVEFEPQEANRRALVIEVPLVDLGRPTHVSLGEGAQFSIRRQPGDALRIKCQNPSLVLQPGDGLDLLIDVHLLGHRTRSVSGTLRWDLREYASHGKPLSHGLLAVKTSINPAQAARVPLALPAPNRPGVYSLSINFHSLGVDESRTVEFVVVDPDSPGETIPSGTATLVDEFDTSRAGIFRKVNRRDTPRWSEILTRSEGTKSDADAVAGEAYRIKLQNPGVPHRVVLTPAPGVSGLGAKLLADGTTCQSLVWHDLGNATASPALARSRTGTLQAIVYPPAKDMMLVLHSTVSGQTAPAATVRIYELPLTAARPNRSAPARLIGRYISNPDLCQALSLTAPRDAFHKQPVESWAEISTACRHMALSAAEQDYNSLVVTALADGGSLYPTSHMPPLCRFEHGQMASDLRDPLPKDVLRLLLAEATRADLSVFAELHLNAPLPALDALANGPDGAGIRLVSADGHERVSSAPELVQRGAIYNILDSRVQAAVGDVLEELAERYEGNAALRGIVLRLSAEGYLALPGLEWGCDTHTLTRFCAATGLKWPANIGESQRPQWLLKNAPEVWSRWRCEELARFYARLAERLSVFEPQLRLVISPHDLIDPTGADLGELASRSGGLDERWRNHGFQLDEVVRDKRILVLRPSYFPGHESPLIAASQQAFNASPNVSDMFRASRSGNLSLILGNRADSSVVPDERWERFRLTRSLAECDGLLLVDGGAQVQWGASESLKSLRRLVSRLPADGLADSGINMQPVVLRLATIEKQTWLCAINSSPFPVQCTLKLDASDKTQLIDLSTGKAIPLAVKEGSAEVKLSLPEYGVWAARSSQGLVTVTAGKTVVSEAALAGLSRRIQQLREEMRREDKSSPLVTVGYDVARKRVLMKTVSSLTLAWDEKRYTDCLKLIDSFAALSATGTEVVPRVMEARRPNRQ